MKVFEGVYTGDAQNNHAINPTGWLNGAATVLLIDRGGATSAGARMTTTSFTAGNAKNLASTNMLTTRINAITSTGFTLGTNADCNANGGTYYYMALQDDGAGDLSVFSYTGDGTDPRTITTPGFLPAFVWIMPVSGNNTWRTTQMATNFCKQLNGGQTLTDAIRSFVSNGFVVGANAGTNTNAAVYHAFAVKLSVHCVTFSYTGDGNDNRTIVATASTPKFAHTNVDNIAGAARKAVCCFQSEGADASLVYDNTQAESANLIQDLVATGIQIGTDAIVNNNGSTYYAVALGDNLLAGRSFVAGVVG